MYFTLTTTEKACVRAILRGYSDDPNAVAMREFVQHGSVSTYEHCMRVAYTSFWLNRRLNLHADELSLVRGAFLHDFYLYDWHKAKHITHWHGFKHPLIARINADVIFHLNDIERDIIQTHMWPLTIHLIPSTREALIVCLADKLCSAQETIWERHPRRDHQ